jgi:hypothetical protein
VKNASPCYSLTPPCVFSTILSPLPAFPYPLTHLTQAPEAAAKLQPVCRALNIDKDDFASKRITAAYNRISGECMEAENSYVAGESDLTRFYSAMPNFMKKALRKLCVCLFVCLSQFSAVVCALWDTSCTYNNQARTYCALQSTSK